MDQDEAFFREHLDRRARIRSPAKTPHRDGQRAVRFLDECEMEYRHLGGHDPKRRRIIAYRLPANHPVAPNHIMKIPFLLFADETVEDRDDVLLPIIQGLMVQEAMK